MQRRFCSKHGAMHGNRIRALREGKGWSQEQLGRAIGRSKSVVSRIESGETGLDLEVARLIADKLNTTLSDVLEISPAASGGFAEDVRQFVPGPEDPLGASQQPNRYYYVVETDACENAGVKRGDVIEIDDSAKAVRGVAPLDIVLVLYHAPGGAETAMSLLRQFVPPALLITNSSKDNARSIDAAREDAHIVGVMVGVPRRARTQSN